MSQNRLTSRPLSVEKHCSRSGAKKQPGGLKYPLSRRSRGDEAQPELRSWGAHPPRVLLDAPRVQPLACVPDTEVLEISMRPMFSARARKTAPEAGALPSNFGVRVESILERQKIGNDGRKKKIPNPLRLWAEPIRVAFSAFIFSFAATPGSVKGTFNLFSVPGDLTVFAPA